MAFAVLPLNGGVMRFLVSNRICLGKKFSFLFVRVVQIYVQIFLMQLIHNKTVDTNSIFC